VKTNKDDRSSRCTIGIDLSILDRVETGTSVYAENLFQALKGLDQSSCEFIALSSPKPLSRKNILSKLYNFALEMFWLTILLPAKVRKLRIELLHMPGNTISPVLRTPQVCSIHDAHFLTNPEGRDFLWRSYAKLSFGYAAKHADRILCDSYSAREEIIHLLGAKPDTIDVVYPGIPDRKSTANDTAAAAPRKPYILSVGATEPNKNFLSLLEAFSRLVRSDRSQGHRLVLAGPSGQDHPNLINFIQQQGLSNRVDLLGHVSDSMLAALYENASIFVFPSFCEGFGFPPLEAMYYGVPVAGSSAPCIPEILGEAPLYFDPHNVSEMSEKIHMILSDTQLRQNLIKSGKARAREFTWENTALKTLDVYTSLLKTMPEN